MELSTQSAQALRMGQEFLVEMVWKRMLTQDGSPLGKGPAGDMQADWLAQNLAQELGGPADPKVGGGHVA
jgi:hypothetical protein